MRRPFPWLDAAVGIHPHDAAKVDDAGWDRVVGWATDQRVVAIGETGLDYDRVFSPIADQLTNLRRNLELALAIGKPAILHCRSADGRRDAQDALVAELRAAGVGGPAWAARSGSDRPRSSTRTRARSTTPREVLDLGLADQLLGPRLPARRGGVGRGGRRRASGHAPDRDRLAVPVAARRAPLA